MDEFKFTPSERLLLRNQYAILALLEESESSRWNISREIIESGYQSEFPTLWDDFRFFSIENCKQVYCILDMFHALQKNYARLSEDVKTLVTPAEIEFRGFSVSDYEERPYHHFAKFLIQRKRQYETLKVRTESLDSEECMLSKYQNMKQTWYAQRGKIISELSIASIRSIVDAGK